MKATRERPASPNPRRLSTDGGTEELRVDLGGPPRDTLGVSPIRWPRNADRGDSNKDAAPRSGRTPSPQGKGNGGARRSPKGGKDRQPKGGGKAKAGGKGKTEKGKRSPSRRRSQKRGRSPGGT